MHTHPVIGGQIVASIESLAPLVPSVRVEHERCDGGGYPVGLTREQLPLASRIAFASDAYTAMMSSRLYRAEAMAPTAAAAEVREHAGTQYALDVARALLSVVGG